MEEPLHHAVCVTQALSAVGLLLQWPALPLWSPYSCAPVACYILVVRVSG